MWGNNRNYRQNPCKDCPNKGCGAYHSQCEKYTAWKSGVESDREKRLKKLEISNTITQLGKHRVATRKR